MGNTEKEQMSHELVREMFLCYIVFRKFLIFSYCRIINKFFKIIPQ